MAFGGSSSRGGGEWQECAQAIGYTVPVTFTAGPGHYATDQGFSYKATQGKTGTAKSS